MKLAKLVLIAALVLSGIAVSSASAASIVVLSGERVSELKYEGKASAATLETVDGKSITCSKTKVTATFTPLAGKETTAEAGTLVTDFEGCGKGEVHCRSESKAGEKDPVQTILGTAALTAAAEESSEKTLQFLLVSSLTETLFINCGGVKQEVKGSQPCLVAPAGSEIAAGEAVKITCALEKPGKPKTGKCLSSTAACEKLAKEPLEGNLGNGFESCAEELTIEGSFNKMALLDD